VQHTEPIIVDFTKDRIIQSFLDAQSKHTKNTYTVYVKRLTESLYDLGKTIKYFKGDRRG